ncbi:GAF domain-containing protein [Pendulispora albinea]|uniref:GAF domain-containing protein n=1 Tax=Pendulispora albinea TaxID=2741071 RepID=A0ABZ2MCT1_9BACT
MQPKQGLVPQIKGILSSLDDRPTKAGQICKAIRANLGHKWVGIYDVNQSEYAVIAWSGPAAPAFVRFAGGRGLTAEAVALRKTVVAGDVKSDPRYVSTLTATQSEIIVPVYSQARNAVVGTIDVQSEHLHAFSKAHRELLEECASVLLSLWQ